MKKQEYIIDQLDHDYILKSKNSALAFVFVSFLFFFLNKLEEDFRIYNTFLLVTVVAISFLRLVNVHRYVTKKHELKKAALFVSIAALVNGALWCMIGIISIISHKKDNFQLLVTFIILSAFSAGSIVTISHKRKVFLPLNYLVLFPQAFYSISAYTLTGDISMLWLIAYTVINLVFNFRQASVVHGGMIKSFSTEYDLKKSLEEIALSKKNLEEESMKTFHASRLSSLGEMAGGVAHEINNPLTIIQVTAKSILMKDESNLDEQIKIKLSKITSACERIAKIVKGMKIISSKNDKMEHEVIKVSKMLELSLSFFEERLKNENVYLQVENSEDPYVKCNQLQISQILINLISNALDALQNIGEEEKKLSIQITENRHHNAVDIRVINSGPLIPEEVASKIFEPFFSTKIMGKGTGLGLSISQTLAHGNQGTLNYENFQGRVCFRLNLSIHKNNIAA